MPFYCMSTICLRLALVMQGRDSTPNPPNLNSIVRFKHGVGRRLGGGRGSTRAVRAVQLSEALHAAELSHNIGRGLGGGLQALAMQGYDQF